jgi:hypothetical protein
LGGYPNDTLAFELSADVWRGVKERKVEIVAIRTFEYGGFVRDPEIAKGPRIPINTSVHVYPARPINEDIDLRRIRKLLNRIASEFAPVCLLSLRESGVEMGILFEGKALFSSLQRLKFHRTSARFERLPSTSGTGVRYWDSKFGKLVLTLHDSGLVVRGDRKGLAEDEIDDFRWFRPSFWGWLGVGVSARKSISCRSSHLLPQLLSQSIQNS